MVRLIESSSLRSIVEQWRLKRLVSRSRIVWSQRVPDQLFITPLPGTRPVITLVANSLAEFGLSSRCLEVVVVTDEPVRLVCCDSRTKLHSAALGGRGGLAASLMTALCTCALVCMLVFEGNVYGTRKEKRASPTTNIEMKKSTNCISRVSCS